MNSTFNSPTIQEWLSGRSEELLSEHKASVFRRADKMFAWLMGAQWLFGIILAVVVAPYAWEGRIRSLHTHVWVAVLLGGALSALPIALTILRPGTALTRHVIAASQMLWSALLIHLSGGRIETHFHVFGSLAFLSFYRDFRLLITATVVVASDHLARGVLWPESVYGITNPEWWRFLEHAGWVIFENVVLTAACVQGVNEMKQVSKARAESEALAMVDREKTVELDAALEALKNQQEKLVRTEKLAAVGQLAASVGHELRNPLSAIRNAATFIAKRTGTEKAQEAIGDARVPQFFTVIDRELTACSRIISDLLDFARERPLSLSSCPLYSLVEDAISVVPPREGVTIRNEVSEESPVPQLDRDQFRQILINLVQNGSESIPAGARGEVVVQCEGGDESPWRITVTDSGSGIPKEIVSQIFQPLFTTKTKGTGLGLAIVASMVQRHRASIDVTSQPGNTQFTITLPANAAAVAA